MEQPVDQERRTFLDRPVRLKWPVYIVFVAILFALALYGVYLWQMRAIGSQAEESVKQAIKAKGETAALAIAILARDDIRNSDFNKLQDYFNDLVRLPQGDIQYMIILKLNGEAAVHTNTKFRGRRLTDDLTRKALRADRLTSTDIKKFKLYDIAVPVMGFTSKIAVLRIGVSYESAAEAVSK